MASTPKGITPLSHRVDAEPARTDALLAAAAADSDWHRTRVHRALTNRIAHLAGQHPVPGYKIAVLSLATDHAADILIRPELASMPVEDAARLVARMIADRCGHGSVEHQATIDALADLIGISSEFVVAQPPLFGPTQCPCVCEDGQLEYVGDGDNNHWSCGHCGLQRACDPIDRENDR